MSPAPPTLRFDRGTLLLSGVERDRMVRWFGEAMWQWDSRVGAWRTHAMHYADARRALRESGCAVIDEVPAPHRIAWPKADLPELRADQRQAVDAWHAAQGRGLIVMPTGTGKTEAVRTAVEETLAQETVGRSTANFDLWLGWGKRAPLNPRPRFRRDDDLWS